jgi:hypothetical protein
MDLRRGFEEMPSEPCIMSAFEGIITRSSAGIRESGLYQSLYYGKDHSG